MLQVSNEARSLAGSKRLQREQHTMQVMIALYCRGQHHPAAQLCADCRALEEYARQRLARCRYGSRKPTCARCPVHCYQPEMRARMRRVMRYAGPRMLLRHPLLALAHFVDSLRPAPTAGARRGG
ncbi:MAG: nitrous oxide-stimulated promoter family protein [Anaerolineae bacterium]